MADISHLVMWPVKPDALPKMCEIHSFSDVPDLPRMHETHPFIHAPNLPLMREVRPI